MRAIILAGGKGTRLHPYTTVFPKPLMPIGEYPILEIVIRQLVKQGFDRVTLAVNHQAEIIKAFFGDGRKWKIKIDYSLEDEPMGTMGPLKVIKDLPPNFLVMNGDVLTDLNFKDFLVKHQTSKALLTVACARRVVKIEYGVCDFDKNTHVITSFKEKPSSDYFVNMGVYALSSRALNLIPNKKLFGFDGLMKEALKQSADSICAVVHKGYWRDIGGHDDYSLAVEEFEGMRAKLLCR